MPCACCSILARAPSNCARSARSPAPIAEPSDEDGQRPRAPGLCRERARTLRRHPARPAGEINVGAVVRHTEDGFDLTDCGSCVVAPACGLTGALHEALAAFMAVLGGY